MGKRLRSTSRPHEEYGEPPIPSCLGGRILMTEPRPEPVRTVYTTAYTDFRINAKKPAWEVDHEQQSVETEEEVMTDEEKAVDNAIIADLVAEPKERIDQLQANMLSGRMVFVTARPQHRGVVVGWRRDGMTGQIYLDVETDGKPGVRWNAWLYDVELVAGDDKREREDPGYLEDEAAETMTDDEIDEAMYRFPEGVVKEHGPAVLVSFSTPEGEPLGSHITYEDGTHQPVEMICAVCGRVHEQQRHCRVCKCIDEHACDGGCSWVENDLCSSCLDDVTPDQALDDLERYESPAAKQLATEPVDHLNPVPAVEPKEIEKQARKGKGKLAKKVKLWDPDNPEFKRWMKTELPWLRQLIKDGYATTHRAFKDLSDQQLAEVNK